VLSPVLRGFMDWRGLSGAVPIPAVGPRRLAGLRAYARSGLPETRASALGVPALWIGALPPLRTGQDPQEARQRPREGMGRPAPRLAPRAGFPEVH
jgi:hypothetical protein